MRESFVTDIPHSLFEGNVCVIMCGMEVILKNVIDLVSIPIFLEPRKFQFNIEKKNAWIQGYLVAKACLIISCSIFKKHWADEKLYCTIVLQRICIKILCMVYSHNK